MAAPGEGAAGTIYDLGYRRYEGERLGRAYAFRSLVVHGVRTVFAVGRGARARIAPLALGALVVLPAVVQSAVAAYTGGGIELVRYENYFINMAVIFALFCAAQAPEMVSADLRSRSLVLYLARALRRGDYAVARVTSLATAVFALAVVPQLVLFTGRVFMAAEPWPALRGELPELPPILASSAVVALLLGTVAVAVASFTERRGIAAAAVIGYFLLSAGLVGVIQEATEVTWVILLDPFSVLDGFAHWIFEATPSPEGLVGQADLPGWTYGATCAAYVAAWGAVLWARFRRIDE